MPTIGKHTKNLIDAGEVEKKDYIASITTF
jgi:hypothetical protein